MVSHSIDICTVAIKSIRNMHVVSTNQIADILNFNDKNCFGVGTVFYIFFIIVHLYAFLNIFI